MIVLFSMISMRTLEQDRAIIPKSEVGNYINAFYCITEAKVDSFIESFFAVISAATNQKFIDK